ncbi:MAG: putative glycosyltransferase, partial [Phycisphaerales bacterium]|nr:putative glycosyltransferase [Phycisphaerales bacterium]
MTFSPVVVAPTYNNAGTLAGVLRRVDALGVPVVVVDDGSTDETAAVLADWLTWPRGHASRAVAHPRNRGKAAAMRTGFDLARSLGHTHAVTIDTDGQLDPADVPAALAAAAADPAAFVLGTRDATAADYPFRSRLGRRASNLLVRMECGLRVSDSQCGLRVYPLAAAALFAAKARRYGFETEVIVRAGWAGLRVAEVPVRCTYFEGTRRVSHFRPWRDSVRAFGMHARLVGRALLPVGPARAADPLPAGPLPANRLTCPRDATPAWRRLLAWLDPRVAWRQVRDDAPEGASRTTMAGSLAIGAFVGCLPTYGLHAVIALYVARRLHLNPVGMVLGTQVSFPPLGVGLAVGSVAVGHLVRRGRIPPPADFAPL